MKGTVTKDNFNGREYFIYLPASYNSGEKYYPVVYVHDGEMVIKLLDDIVSPVESTLEGPDYEEHIIVGVMSIQRLDEYTPWPGPAIEERFRPFGGKGGEYLEFLVRKLKPHIDAKYRTRPGVQDTHMMGVSLGGLISIFAIYLHDSFGKVASISGSMWYRGWLEFMRKNIPQNPGVQIMLSCGSAEGKGKPNPLRHTVLFTRMAHKMLESQLSHTSIPLIWDDGNHHDYRAERLRRGLLWICERKMN